MSSLSMALSIAALVFLYIHFSLDEEKYKKEKVTLAYIVLSLWIIVAILELNPE